MYFTIFFLTAITSGMGYELFFFRKHNLKKKQYDNRFCLKIMKINKV